MAINVVIVQYNDRSLPDSLLLTQASNIVAWFNGTNIIIMFCYDWWLCMAINISVQYNGGLLPDIILLTRCSFAPGLQQ